MSREVILAIDQGTTNTKAMLVDATGTITSQASCTPSINYPHPAWVEQDPLELWRTVREAVDQCMQASDHPVLAAVAITNQRESVMLWERRTGAPVGPCIVWQCHRTASFCNELHARGLEPLLRQRTGLTIDPLFSASKAGWLLDNTENGRSRAGRGELCLGTVDAWVLWNLTGGAVHACDMTNASRTQLYDIRRLQWDDELLEIFGVPPAALPEVKPSSTVYGETMPIGNLPGGVPIACLIGDSHGALYGHAGFQPGAIKATYGTGSSLMTPIPAPVTSERGLSTTIAWAREQVTYALEGNIYVTGAAVQWLGQFLGFDNPGEGIEKLARQAVDNGGVYFIPAFVGLGAPHWNEAARGLIAGLTHGVTPAHLARATLEAIAYQVRDVFDVMEAESGTALQVLLADGGATRNDLLMQLQADIVGRPVVRSLSSDVSALGAAYLAGLAVDLWSSEAEIEKLPRPCDRFEPRLSDGERAELYAGWQKAIARTMFDPDAQVSPTSARVGSRGSDIGTD
jgi:glycerol kinase